MCLCSLECTKQLSLVQVRKRERHVWLQAREAVRHATLEGKALQTPEGLKVRGRHFHASRQWFPLYLVFLVFCQFPERNAELVDAVDA